MAYDFEDPLLITVGSEYTPAAKASIMYDGPAISIVMPLEYTPGARAALNYDPSIQTGGSTIVVISSALNPGIERGT